VLSALEYASWIGCRTVALTGSDGGAVARSAELAIEVPTGHVGSVEEVHLMVCHMIGYYFVESEKTARKGA